MEDWIQLYQLDTYQAQSVRCDAKSLEDTLIKRVMDLRSFPCLFFSNHWCNARGCNEWPDYRFLWPEKGNENVNSILHNRMVSPLLLKDPYSTLEDFSQDMELELSHVELKLAEATINRLQTVGFTVVPLPPLPPQSLRMRTMMMMGMKMTLRTIADKFSIVEHYTEFMF
ncbi:uncharacterized protein DS421_11g330840 [Arachis hypogaea]|nr:uncharacterized protein DS421_11g330840 [Arachis hypogaea]